LFAIEGPASLLLVHPRLPNTGCGETFLTTRTSRCFPTATNALVKLDITNAHLAGS
jgi:hypothetical protein